MAEPYMPQVGINPAPLPGMSTAGTDAIGGALENVGSSVDRTIHQIKERDRDTQATDAGLRLAQVSAAMDKYATDARASAAPGAAGHSDAIDAKFDEQANEAIGSIRDKKIREAFKQRYAELKGNISGREYGWEAAQRVDKMAADFGDMTDTLNNGQQANPDAIGLDVSLKTIETTGRHL